MDISVFRAVRTVVLGTLILGVFAVVGLSSATPVDAAEGINQRINFQGRLLNKQGATVPDGFYNIQFKIYQDGDGQSANNATGSPAGSLEWTETRLNDDGNGVKIRNGYFSVELGSVNPFGTQVDWNQDTLWLSLNVGNTNATCTPFSSCSPDGEMLPMKRLSSTPYALNAGMLGGRTAAGFIHNNAGTPQAANISIQSADAADIAAVIQGAAGQTADIFQVKADSVATPLLAVSSAGNVTITPTSDASPALTVNSTTGTIFSASATEIALNENTTVASGKTLTVSGDTAVNIAGYSGASEGAITYDTDNNQLLVYSNGKWKADSTDAILVAASNSSQADKNAADFVADGNTGAVADGDQVQINDALTAGAGKKVVLLAGTYVADATILVPNNTTFSGVGDGTVIQLADIDFADNLIQNSDSSTGTGVTIRDMKLDGQRSLNTAGIQNGIYLNNLGDIGSNRFGGTVSGVTVSNFRSFGILAAGTSALIDITGNKATNNETGINADWNTSKLTISDNLSISNTGYGFGVSGSSITVDGNTARNSGSDGFYVYNEYNIVSNNISEANSSYGFQSFGGLYLTFTGNIAKDNTNSGFQMYYDTGSSVTNNSLKGNGSDGIQLSFSTENKVSGNYIHDSGGNTTNKGIRLTSADNNTVTDNVITDTSCTTTCYAIDIDSSASENNYLSNNAFSTASGTATIRDLGTGTRYANQSVTQNSLDVLYRQTNSASAFQIQNTTGAAQLTADTTNSRIQIGSSTTDATAIVFALDNFNQATDPTGVNGAMYYNTDSNKFRCYQNGAWTDCIGVSGANASLSNLSGVDINAALNATNNDLTLQTTTTGDVNIAPAGVINLQGDTVLAAGNSLTLTGGGTRPGSPTEGMVFYDTATDQLLTYTGSKWQADRSDAVLVAANNSSPADKTAADFVADGTGDQTEINDALTAGSGKKVVLLAGTYTISASVSIPNNTTLAGVGNGSVITLPNSHNATIDMIVNSDTSTGSGVAIRDIKINGNRSNQTAGNMRGIYFLGMGSGLGAGSRQGSTVERVSVENMRGTAIDLSDTWNSLTDATNIDNVYGGIHLNCWFANSNYNTVTNNRISGVTSTWGIYMCDDYNTVTGNIIDTAADFGILTNGTRSTISNNTVRDSVGGIGDYNGGENTITDNSLVDNSGSGITLSSSHNTTLGSNKIFNSGGSTANNGIVIDASDSTTITGNTITDTSCTTTCRAIDISNATSDNTYLSNNTFSTTSGTATIRDLGTGTRYANQTVTQNGLDARFRQTNSSTAFQIQNATGVAQLTANTTSNRIQVGSSTTDATAIVFALDNYNQATDPTGVNGAMYYNTTSNKFRCYENGAWADCIGAGAGTFADRDLSNLTATSINQSLIANANNTLDLGSNVLSWRSGYFGTAVYSPLFDTSSASALSIGTTNATSVTIGQAAVTTTLASNTVSLGSATGDTTLQKSAQTTADTAGARLTIQGSTGNGTGNGGTVTLQGGNGGVTNGNGGNLELYGGTGSGTGVTGLVKINTAAYATASVQNSDSTTNGINTNITQASIDSYGAIIVNATGDFQSFTLSDPTLGVNAAGRVIYVTAALGSNEFTLLVNGGGAGNQIAMRQNTTATMIWNGSDWTVAGASSSTTLQSAYDNTLQSAGGAELVVSNTGNTNGLTIRDSVANPVNDRLLTVQTSSAADLISINGNVTEYASNAGAEIAGGSSITFPANTWSGISGATVDRQNTAGDYIATGQGSVGVTTNTTVGSGAQNRLTTTLTALTTYNVSFATRLDASSSAFTDLEVQFSRDGTTTGLTACTSGKVVPTSVWSKVNCTFTAPSSGITSSNAIFIRQTGSGTAHEFYIDNLSVTIAADYNYATDGSVSDNTNFATNWTSVSGATVTRDTTTGQDASDSARVVTTGAGQGVRNKLSINPLANTLYRVTAYANITSGSFDNFTVRYSRDGGTNFKACADYNTQTVVAGSTYTKITCYVETDATAASDPYVYFTQTDGTGRTFFVDSFSMTLSTITTPNVQIGGGVNGGPTTLFTLDRGASAPIASDNDSLLGSMYYDTTLGKLQCYEADGWGACGSSPDNIITISPEYTNAVLHGPSGGATGIGTMTSDICSDYLNINDASNGDPVCGTDETYNFYKWTSPQATNQTYGIFVTYQLPDTFKQFASGQTSIMGRTDDGPSTGAAEVSYKIYRNSSTGMTQCGGTVAVSSGSVSSWQTGVATGAADPSTCGFAGGDSIVFEINVSAYQNANAYVGNLNFTFSNR